MSLRKRSYLSERISKETLSFSDVVDQNVLQKSGKGSAKIDGRSYKWFVSKYFKSGSGTVSSEKAAIRDQRIVVNKKARGKSVAIEIAPIGNYFVVKMSGKQNEYFSSK